MSLFHKARACALLACGGLTANAAAQGTTAQLANNAFNPAISVILNGKYAPLTDTPGRIPGFPFGGESGPLTKGLFLDESEFVFSGNIDDRYFGNVTAALHSAGGETEVELEEAYIDALGLGHGVTIKAGRFFSNIGYLNPQHPHSWDFVDTALPYRAMLGTQFGDDGVQLRWIAPTPVFLELGAEVFRGDAYPAGGAANDGMGAYTASAHVGGDVGMGHSWRAGLSGFWADAEDREAGGGGHAHGTGGAESSTFTGDVNLGVFDFVWKWAPHGNPTQRNLTVQGEYLFRHEDGVVAVDEGIETSDLDGDQYGWYLQSVYQFSRGWRIGARYDRLASDNTGADIAVLEEAGLDDHGHTPQRFSVMMDYARSEFSRLRLQLNRDESQPSPDHQIIVQFIMSLGAHGAHKF